MTLAVVLTTINPPTASVRALCTALRDIAAHLVVAGDAKGPAQFNAGELLEPKGALSFLSLEAQVTGPFPLAKLLPTKHYCRKNVAYLHAIAAGAECIYETDDDNSPLASWKPREQFLEQLATIEATCEGGPKWANVYRHFSDEPVWPRGIPLDHIHAPIRAETWSDTLAEQHSTGEHMDVQCPIQQGLVNGSPDVDAIWRLTQDRDFSFDNRPSVLLPPGNWCPFNTQTTWWWPVAYPLLYIPSYCSFRMCDIWKSFVAQRCLWELGLGVVFHAPEVFQDRNPHNLMTDFKDEVPGYLQNHRIAEILESTSLQPGIEHVSGNLLRCYEALIAGGILPPEEKPLVETWLQDLESCTRF